MVSQLGSQEFTIPYTHTNKDSIAAMDLRPSDHVALIDASHNYYECSVISVEKTLKLRIAKHAKAPQLPCNLTVVQGISAPDIMDRIVGAATEIGAQRIVPLTCERGVVVEAKDVKSYTDYMNDIALRASMLSGRTQPSIVESPINMHDSTYGLSTRDCVIICYEQEDATSISDALHDCAQKVNKAISDLKVAIVVGPQGGFASHEIDRLCSSNTHVYTATLGPSILSVETAGVIAPAICAYEMGGLRSMDR